MPLINLIQEQRLALMREQRRARSLFLLFTGTLVASVGTYGALAFQSDRLEQEAAKLNTEIQRMAPLLAQIEKQDNERKALLPRLKSLEDAQATSERWSRILYHVSTQTPPDVWLTGFRSVSNDPSAPVMVTFQGMAMAQEPVGEFILRLQNAEDLERVNLKFTQEKLVNATRTKEFQLEAAVVGTASEVKTDVEGKL